MQEDFIDLRVYVDILLRRRRVIVLLAALLAGAALLYSLLSAPVYRAKTGLVVAPKRADLSLTTALDLSAEEYQRVDLRTRNAALVEIARSLEIAQRVMENHPDLASALEVETPGALAAKVEVSGKDDWISIQVSAGNPDLAARLASAWAQEAEKRINTLYAPDAVIENNLGLESQSALETYQETQVALEDFLRQSRVAEIQSQIKKLETSIDWSALDLQLMNIYQQEVLLNQLLRDAEALKQQLQRDAGSSSNSWGVAMSFITLQTQTFSGHLVGSSYRQNLAGLSMDLTSRGVNPGTWYLDLSATPPLVTVADVESLMRVLEAKLEQVQAELATPIADNALTQARSAQINDLAQELTRLRLELEQENAQSRQLVSARDAAWDTYQALIKKLREVQVESAVTSQEVQIAFESVPPSKPSEPRLVMNVGFGLIAGLLLGVVWALLQGYVGKASLIPARTKLGRWLLNASGLPNYPPQAAS
ncbi:MAG: hypothetical protein JW892_07795 [Anaerolineae bacterium]|nr:hypothetical protein [Anaerolineae bacterium]